MSCISSNFSSFFLNSLNDPSEFSKYLSNGELKCTQFEEFQVFGCGAGASSGQQQQSQQLQQQQLQYSHTHLSNGCGTDFSYEAAAAASSSSSHTQRETCLPASSGSGNPTTTPSSHSHTVAAAAAAAAAAAYVAAESGVAAAAAIPGAAGGSVVGPSPASNRWPTAVATPNGGSVSVPQHFDGSFEFIKYLRHSTDFTPGTASATAGDSSAAAAAAAASEKSTKGVPGAALAAVAGAGTPPPPPQSPVASAGLLDLDTSTSQKSRSASRKVAALLSSVSRASNSHQLDTSSSALDVFDHDSKQTIFDLQHMASNGSSNSNESSLELLAFPNSHLNASNSNTSSEGAACGSAGEFGGILTGASSSSTASSSSHAPKLLGSFVIKENFEVHPSHKVEEGIFQHMNKLPSKKKDTLKQLGVRFTGQMTLTDKSIVVENFIKFCEEYEIKDHRPWLSLNQCGLNKPEQIKFARYLGQGLPTFTLFCIYSNYKNLFCTKRTEIYTKDGYNLPYILDKTKRFLANTTADLKNMAAANDGSLEFAAANSSSSSSTSASTNLINSNSNSSSSSGTVNLSATMALNTNSSFVAAPPPLSLPPTMDPRYVCGAPPTPGLLPPPALGPPPRSLEQMIIYENFEVHETHRIEDGVCTHISRLPPKKQELLKQFGIQSSGQQCLSNYEKYILIENFIKFCNEYQISDHRPFLDFHESALSKCEQLKFVRYLGQGLSNLTLNKIYVAFKDLLGNGRPEKAALESYNLDILLKKKRKNLYNRMHSAAPSIDLTAYDTAQAQPQPQPQPHAHPHLHPHHSVLSTPRPHHAFAALNVATQRSDVCNELTPAGLQYSYAGNGSGTPAGNGPR
ncbi:uncharacterized protein [Drosophila pseudoobscura]|uniref:Uncharacterized protein isoform X1 n=1 Tax=Drosophila pseudoobscura pseudoobscura TaxID=46245 RepID=A0A6I8WBQ7_DROPS|nr:uncharacterized protein LOC4812468 isoform X1 [Drosophila pseudoobscura]